LEFSEIIKTCDNFLRDWQIYAWRTKEKAEIDFIVQGAGKTLFIESKLAIHGASPFDLDPEARKVFSPPYKKIVVSAREDMLQSRLVRASPAWTGHHTKIRKFPPALSNLNQP